MSRTRSGSFNTLGDFDVITGPPAAPLPPQAKTEASSTPPTPPLRPVPGSTADGPSD